MKKTLTIYLIGFISGIVAMISVIAIEGINDRIINFFSLPPKEEVVTMTSQELQRQWMPILVEVSACEAPDSGNHAEITVSGNYYEVICYSN